MQTITITNKLEKVFGKELAEKMRDHIFQVVDDMQYRHQDSVVSYYTTGKYAEEIDLFDLTDEEAQTWDINVFNEESYLNEEIAYERIHFECFTEYADNAYIVNSFNNGWLASDKSTNYRCYYVDNPTSFDIDENDLNDEYDISYQKSMDQLTSDLTDAAIKAYKKYINGGE